ncbi:hypothetical protein ACHAWF_012608, partial [Thalassiosira exigua]
PPGQRNFLRLGTPPFRPRQSRRASSRPRRPPERLSSIPRPPPGFSVRRAGRSLYDGTPVIPRAPFNPCTSSLPACAQANREGPTGVQWRSRPTPTQPEAASARLSNGNASVQQQREPRRHPKGLTHGLQNSVSWRHSTRKTATATSRGLTR